MFELRRVATIVLTIASLGLVFPGTGWADTLTARVALLIGNSDYPDSDAVVPTPIGDAHRVADALKARGFAVDVVENGTRKAMDAALGHFLGSIKKDSIALLFYAGHGVQLEGKNYLIPVNARIWNDADVVRDGVAVDQVLTEMTKRGARANILIVDASRRNPFERRFRSVSEGLAAAVATPGTLSLQSAAPGTIVNDDPSATTSLFATDLATQIGAGDVDAEQALAAVREDVSSQTQNQQNPTLVSDLDAAVWFDPNHKAAEPARLPPPPVALTQDPSGVKAAAALPEPPPTPPSTAPAPAAPTLSAPAAAPPAPVAATGAGTKSETVVAGAPPAPEAPKPVAPPPAQPEAPVVAMLTPPPLASPAREAQETPVPVPPAAKSAVAVAPPPPPAEAPQVAPVAPPSPEPEPEPAVVKPQRPAAEIPKPTRTPYAPAEIKAKAALDRRVALDAHDEEAFFERGQMLAEHGEYLLALADFDRSISLNPNNPEAFNNRCWTRAMENQLETAMDDCNEALKLRANFADAHDSRGLVLLKLGAARAAVLDYNAALRLNPKHSSALYGRGIAELRLGKNSDAESDFSSALALDAGIERDYARYGLK